MLNIKSFIAKVSAMDSKHGKSVVLSMDEARQLRDELAGLLADRVTELSNRKVPEQVTQVEIIGGKF